MPEDKGGSSLAALVFFEFVLFFNLMGMWLCYVFDKKIKEKVYDGRFAFIVRDSLLPRFIFMGSVFIWAVFAQVIYWGGDGVENFINKVLFFWLLVSFLWFYLDNIRFLEKVVFSPYFKLFAAAYGAVVAVFSSFYVDSYLSQLVGMPASLLGGVYAGMVVIFSLFLWGATVSVFLLFVSFLYALQKGDDYKEEAAMIFCGFVPLVVVVSIVLFSDEFLGSPNIERRIVEYAYYDNFKVAEEKIEHYRREDVRDVKWCTNLPVTEKILFLPNAQVSRAREVDGVYRFQIEDCARDPIKVGKEPSASNQK